METISLQQHLFVHYLCREHVKIRFCRPPRFCHSVIQWFIISFVAFIAFISSTYWHWLTVRNSLLLRSQFVIKITHLSVTSVVKMSKYASAAHHQSVFSAPLFHSNRLIVKRIIYELLSLLYLGLIWRLFIGWKYHNLLR